MVGTMALCSCAQRHYATLSGWCTAVQLPFTDGLVPDTRVTFPCRGFFSIPRNVVFAASAMAFLPGQLALGFVIGR